VYQFYASRLCSFTKWREPVGGVMRRRRFVKVEESPQGRGVVGKKRETERFMSDMVIFISRGKKVRFHAVGAFIPFSDDKGIERENEEWE